MAERVDLDGSWEFELDPDEGGLERGWAEGRGFADTMVVPGCWQTEHKRLPAEAERTHYRRGLETNKDASGSYLVERGEHYESAWYSRSFSVPAAWAGSEVELVCDGVAPSARFWIDGRPVGEHRKGPWLPARIRITEAVRPGATHRLVVAVGEELRILQGVVKSHFSGLWKSVYLESFRTARCTELFVRAGPGGEALVEAAVARVSAGGAAAAALRYSVSCAAADGTGRSVESSGRVGSSGRVRALLAVSKPRPWSPEAPFLYRCTFTLLAGGEPADTRTVLFGFRSFSTAGRRILLNGRPIFLRGCGCAGRFQVEDYSPSTDIAYWRAMMRRIKEYGFNWLRWHSGFMPHECLQAADEEGILISSELFLTLWETEAERALTKEQWSDLIREYRNHPSIWIWSMGNEQDSPHPEYVRLIGEMYATAKKLCPGVLVTTTDGIAPTSKHEEPNDVYMVSSGAAVGAVLDMAPLARLEVGSVEKPLVVHELGYAESLPKHDSLGRVRDPAMLPLVRKMLAVAAEKGLTEKLPGLVANSERLVTLSYGKAIEDLRKCDGLAGYNQWIYRDVPEEYSGLVGPWHEDKAGMDSSRAMRINGQTAVLMTPLLDRYTLADGEPFPFTLHVSHHGSRRLAGELRWRLTRDGKVVDKGRSSVSAGPLRVVEAGPFEATARKTGVCSTLILEAVLEAPGLEARNEWELRCFPQELVRESPLPVYQLQGAFSIVEDRSREYWPFIRVVREPAVPRIPADSVLLAPVLLPSVVDFLLMGGRVLYCPAYYLHNSNSLPTLPSSWHNLASWSGTDGNCGTYITSHPALGDFPNPGWADLGWYDLMSGARDRASAPYWNVQPRVFDLDAWPVKVEPIVGSIGYCTKLTNRAYLFEANAGAGKLLAAGLRIYESVGTHPESRYLMDRFLRYATGPEFAPAASVGDGDFRKLIRNQTGIAL